MTSLSLFLSILLGCGGSAERPVADPTTPDEGVEAPGEQPPEGFTCPEGTTLRSGSVEVASELWHRPTLPRPQGEAPMLPPDDGLVDVHLVPEMDEFSRVHACVREDGSRHGPYHATSSGGDGRVEGAFTEGQPSGDWLGLWILDEPRKPAEPPAEAPADDAPAEGEAPVDGAPTEGGGDGAEEPAEPSEPAKPGGEPVVPEGARLMFAGSYGEGGIQVGRWFQGCDPGCNLDYQIRGLFGEDGKMGGKWTFLGDQEVMTAFFAMGALNGRYVATWGEQTTRGSYARGEKRGKWETMKGNEVIESKDYGGQVRRGSGRGRGR